MYIKFSKMIIISSTELHNNKKKYLKTATTQTIVFQKGNTETFVVQKKESPLEVSPEVPATYYRVIIGKEVISGIEKGLKN